jgi:hypothetical protein
MKKIILCLLFNFTLIQAKDTNTKFIDEALKSNDIEMHIVAGILAKSFEFSYTNQQLYSKAFKLDPNNILLLEQMVRFCNDTSLICQKQNKYLKYLEKQDSKNAVPNLYAIAYFGKNKHYSKALKQLKKAANKKVFDDYNFKRFFLVDKVLRSYGYTSSQAKKIATKFIFIDFANEPIVKINNLCVKQSKINYQWIEPCIGLGKIMETSSTMILSTFIGYAIQRDVLALDKNREVEYENVKHRRDVFHQFRLRVVTNIKYGSLSEETKFDEVPEIFYKEYQKFGERVALQRALDRLKDKKN